MPAVIDDLTARVMKLSRSGKKQILKMLGEELMREKGEARITVSKSESERLVLVRRRVLETKILTDAEAEAKWPNFKEWKKRALAGEGELLMSGEIHFPDSKSSIVILRNPPDNVAVPVKN